MKKILSLAMAIAMLCLAAVPAFAADDELPANCYSKQYVVPAEKAPTIDGKITAEEWGEAEWLLNTTMTNGQRTYCRDWYAGLGILMSDFVVNWSYDADNFYLAMTWTNPKYDSDGGIGKSYTEKMTFVLGKVTLPLDVVDGKVTATGNAKAALTAEGETRNLEISVPLKDIGADGSFTGNFEHDIDVSYVRKDGTGEGNAQIKTHSTPIFAEAAKTHDLFVLAKSAADAQAAIDAANAAKKAEIAPLYHNITLKKAAGTPVIDGKIDEAEYGAPFAVREGEGKVGYSNSLESANGPDMTVYLAWDAKYLYIAAKAEISPFKPSAKHTDTAAPHIYVMMNDGNSYEQLDKSWQDLDAIHFTNFYDDGSGIKSNTWFSMSTFPAIAASGQVDHPSADIADRSGAGKSAYTLVDGEGDAKTLYWEVAYDWSKIDKDGKVPTAGDVFTLSFKIADPDGNTRLVPNVEGTTTEGYYLATLSNEVNGAAGQQPAETEKADDTTKAQDTTKAEDTTKAAEQTEAPATFDAFVIAAVVASAAAAGIVVSKKRR